MRGAGWEGSSLPPLGTLQRWSDKPDSRPSQDRAESKPLRREGEEGECRRRSREREPTRQQAEGSHGLTTAQRERRCDWLLEAPQHPWATAVVGSACPPGRCPCPGPLHLESHRVRCWAGHSLRAAQRVSAGPRGAERQARGRRGMEEPPEVDGTLSGTGLPSGLTLPSPPEPALGPSTPRPHSRQVLRSSKPPNRPARMAVCHPMFLQCRPLASGLACQHPGAHAGEKMALALFKDAKF